jgi:hypothetical protein
LQAALERVRQFAEANVGSAEISTRKT